MTTYTDRYVTAAARAVPDSAQADLRAELKASIADAVEARVDAGESPETAERAVLTGLGDPERLAAQYADRPLYLIGPGYYLMWRRLTGTLLSIVPPIVGVVMAVVGVLAGDGLGTIAWSVVTTVLMVIGAVAFWTTLAFAVVERSAGRSADDQTPWSPDSLPAVKPTQSGLSELVATLCVIALVVALVVWDHVHGFVDADGQPVPVLDPGLWPWAIAGLFVVLLLDAVLAVAIYRRGCWTVRLAVANAVLSLAFALPALWLLAQDRLINPALISDVVTPVSTELAQALPAVVAIGIVLVTAIDIGDAAVKAVRARRYAVLG